MKSFQGISWNTIVKAERSCILGIESERTHRQRKKYDRAYQVASKRCRGNADVIRYSNQYILSGGVDSSLVTAICAKKLQKEGKNLNTFSFDFVNNHKYFKSNAFQPSEDRPWVDKMV